MLRIFQSEWIKMRKSSILVLTLVSPFLATLVGLGIGIPNDIDPYLMSLMMMSYVHALLLLPLLTGVLSAFICRFEHLNGGWKQLLSMPVSRWKVYVMKYVLVMVLVFITQLLFFIGLFLVGQMRGFQGPFPWDMALSSVLGGFIACLPIAALQMFVSVAWSSFAAPMAINVIFTLPNILIANSETFGPFYPWGQPFLAMMPFSDESFGALNVGPETLFLVILTSFVLFFFSGIMYFQRKEI